MADGFVIAIDTDPEELYGVVEHLRNRISPGALEVFMYDYVEPWLRARTSRRFMNEGDDVVGNWHPLAKATEEIRSAKGYPPAHPINVRQGLMEHFLVSQRGDVKQFGYGARVTYPAPGPSGVMHKIETAQKGKKFPSTPPRPVLGVNENDLMYITSELAAWIIDAPVGGTVIP